MEEINAGLNSSRRPAIVLFWEQIGTGELWQSCFSTMRKKAEVS